MSRVPFLVPLSLISLLLALPGASLAQNLTGVVLAGDTGAPISGATVRAVGVTSSPAQAPSMYETQTDVNGEYALPTPVGLYRVCVSAGGPYLNPCLWGGALTVAAGAAPSSVRLQKGAMFIARIHASHDLLAQAETVHGGAVNAHIAAGPFAKFPLPVVYESATVRDYGEVLPLNLAITLAVSSPLFAVMDSAGAAAPLQGIAFTITDSDFAPASLFAMRIGGAAQRPAAKIMHFYVNR
jgi:hypothetical protein